MLEKINSLELKCGDSKIVVDIVGCRTATYYQGDRCGGVEQFESYSGLITHMQKIVESWIRFEQDKWLRPKKTNLLGEDISDRVG